VDGAIGCGRAVLAQVHHLRLRVVEPDPAVSLLSEEERLAVLDQKAAVVSGGAIGKEVIGAVVEGDTVLVDLDERGAPVQCRLAEDPCQVLLLYVK